MLNRRRRLWIILFVGVVLLLTVLATGWNVVLVRDYFKMLELARSLHELSSAAGASPVPWTPLILGTLGFVAALGILVVFFIKILREMKLNQAQAEFLASVSHELKTPIASIELSASLLRAGGLSPEETERLWSSHHAALKRLREEVLAILEAARWQAGPPKVRLEPANLEEWLRQSIARWKTLLGPSASITREGDPLPEQVLTEIKSINLIADNLLDNARKFSKTRTAVVIRTRVEGARWSIEFHDDGLGFEPGDAKKIFERFYRSSHQAPYAIPGTGLGLHLAYSASRALGLSLKGFSRGLGHGAVFTLSGKQGGR
jgi:signal transduction histidine kinase